MHPILLGHAVALWVAASSTSPVVVDSGFEAQVLGRHLELLRDADRRLDARAVLRGEHDRAFRRAPHDDNGLGYTHDALWVRFALDNRSAAPLPLMLELSYAPLDDVQLTLVQPDGGLQELRSGDLLPFDARPLPARTHVFPLTAEPGVSTVLLRATSSGPLNVPLALYRPATLAHRMELEGVLLWMFYGLLCGLILYNLFLFSSVRDLSYLYYTAYIACFGLFLLCHNGLAKRYLWPGPGDWNHQVMIAAAYAATVTAVAFSRRFLDTARTVPRVDRLLRVLGLIGVVGTLVFVVAYVGVLERAGVMLLVVVAILLLASGIAVWRQGFRPARFYVLAWSTLLLGIAAGLLKALGWFPITFWTTWGFQIGAAVEAVLLSLALADRIHDLRAQTERLNAKLAGKVEERTRSLELASSHLAAEASGRLRAEDERNQLQAQLLQAQKMEAIGRLAGGVAHDINNVLGAIMGFASLATDATDSSHPAREDLTEILAAAARGRDLTNNLLGFARRSAQTRRICDLNELLLEVQHLLERTALKRVRLEHDLHPTPLRVLGDASELSQAIMNLCVNALDASPGDGAVVLGTDVVTLHDSPHDVIPALPPGRYARVHVRDSGHGMDDQTRTRALEPFFTTKPPGQGTGLGLAMVYGAMRRHNGGIQLQSEPGQGTQAWLWLPLAEAGELVPSSDEDGAGLPTGTGTILVVDDEDNVRLALRRMLERLGYQVLEAAHGAAALECYAERWADIVLVMLDLRMPDADGRAVLRQILDFNPQARVLLCTGYGTDEELALLRAEGIRGVLPKPFTLHELASTIASVLASAAPPPPA